MTNYPNTQAGNGACSSILYSLPCSVFCKVYCHDMTLPPSPPGDVLSPSPGYSRGSPVSNGVFRGLLELLGYPVHHRLLDCSTIESHAEVMEATDGFILSSGPDRMENSSFGSIDTMRRCSNLI